MVVSCPELHSTDLSAGPDPETARRHERVIAAVTGFCPDVEVVEPGVCAFGARGPARYFGGETALAARITAALADLGVAGRVGVADGLFSALLAARDGTTVPPGGTARFLAAKPVSVLADQDLSAQDLITLLKRLGLGTLGDFAVLPVRDVASRFGDAGEYAHRLARGLDSRPLATRPPPADLSVAHRFDPPEPRAEPVVFTAKALAGRLHDGLAARGLTCVRVQVSATWADGRESSRLWRHDGLLSAAAVADRVRWQLDGRPPDDGKPEENTPGRHHRAAARAGPGRPRHRAAAHPVGGDAGQRPGGPGRHAGAGHARARGRAAPRPRRRQERARPGDTHPVRRENRAPPARGPALARPGQGYGARPGLSRRPRGGGDRRRRAAVTVSGRCAVSATPARLAVRGEPPRRVTGWAGPWPLSERWWDQSAARRRARFQLATEDGRAWLAVVEDGRWLVEAGYWLGGLG